MEMLKKLKKYGFLGCIKKFYVCISWPINNLIYYICCIFPVDDHLIMMESEGDLSDNAYALFDYMKQHQYLETYQVVWLVDDVERCTKIQLPNTKYMMKVPTSIQVRRSYYMARCRWYIYDHCNLMATVRKRKKQSLVYLSHGLGYKAGKNTDFSKDKSRCDLITVTGPHAEDVLAKFCQEPLEKIKITGYPRLDYFYQDHTEIQNYINEKWNAAQYKKIIFWMPTFRKSCSELLSEDYIKNETGLPMFDTKEALLTFSDFLKKNEILLILKVHHLQAELPVFQQQFPNIRMIKDEELQKNSIQLYQIIPMADGLITDYSSVAIDYLLLNRPIIFTLDDYDKYAESRGFYPENAIDYMPGYHVYNRNELENSIKEICQGIDKFSEQRKNILSICHTFQDGNSSQRVLDCCGIS